MNSSAPPPLSLCTVRLLWVAGGECVLAVDPTVEHRVLGEENVVEYFSKRAVAGCMSGVDLTRAARVLKPHFE